MRKSQLKSVYRSQYKLVKNNFQHVALKKKNALKTIIKKVRPFVGRVPGIIFYDATKK
jgi:hypothetical protein